MTHQPQRTQLHTFDPTGHAATTVIIAGHDPLRDEAETYAQRLRDAGIPLTHAEFPRMPHGYVSFPRFTRDAIRTLRIISENLASSLHT